jgi:hypothetical protein
MKAKIEYFDSKLIGVDFDCGYKINVDETSENIFKNFLNFLCDKFGEGNLIHNNKYTNPKWILINRNHPSKITIILQNKKDLELFCNFFKIKMKINYDLTISYMLLPIIKEFLFEVYTWKKFCQIREKISKKLIVKTSNIHKTEKGLTIDYFGKRVAVKF